MLERAAILFVAILAANSQVGSALLTLQDDRGLVIKAPIRVCFSRGLETECRDAPPWVPSSGFETFDSVTIEGPDHGPVELTREKVARIVRIPRKAVVQVHHAPADGSVIAALYFRNDESFKRPAQQLTLAGGQIKIPARPSLLALLGEKAAPDLHLLSPLPGQRYTVNYRAASGWSLVVRCVERGDRRAVSSARLALEATKPAGETSILTRGESEGDGLAVFGPLSAPFVTLIGAAPGLLDSTAHGVGTSPGRFEYRELVFEHGGTVEAVVSIDGDPAKSARCLLVSTTAPRRREGALVPEPDVFSDTRTDAKGECRTRPARGGSYLFRVVPIDGSAGRDESVALTEGSVTRTEVSLTRIPVQGTVERARKPVAGAVVYAALEGSFPSGGSRSTFPEPLKAVTDENGHYSGYLWAEGYYSFELMPTTDSRTTAADRSVEVGLEGATVDFNLNDASVTGTVADEEGRFVEGAWVRLEQTTGPNTISRGMLSDPEGRFRFSLEGDGLVEVRAGKKGYKTSDTRTIPISDDTEAAPVILTLSRLDSVEGRVLTSGGAPVPGVFVSSWTVGVPVQQGDATTDADGRFLVPRAPGGSTRIFVSGSGCELQAADIGRDEDQVVIGCGADYSAVKLTLEAADESPLQDEWVFLRWNGVLVPRLVLMRHFAQYSMPWTTDGNGTLSIVGIAPGRYDVFLGQASSEFTISQNQPYGFIGSFNADAGSTTELEFEVEVSP